MPALVLAAGLGTRLRPLTDSCAKPAIPLAGEPIIRRIVRWLANHDVRDLVVNLHYLPQTVTGVLGDGSDLSVRIRYSWEQPRILGSAGGPRHALDILGDDTFIIVNGDTLTDLNLGALLHAHRTSGALVTMALVPNREPDKYGGVVLDSDDAVTGFVPRGAAAAGSRHFIGVQVVSRIGVPRCCRRRPAGEFDRRRRTMRSLKARRGRDSRVRVRRGLLGYRDGRGLRTHVCGIRATAVMRTIDHEGAAIRDRIDRLPCGRGSARDAPPRVVPLTGDASDRRYFRIISPDGRSTVLALHTDAIDFASLPFANVAGLLQRIPLPVPAILGHSDPLGIVELQDLGDVTLQAHLGAATPAEHAALYREAVALIERLQRRGAELGPASPGEHAGKRLHALFDCFRRRQAHVGTRVLRTAFSRSVSRGSAERRRPGGAPGRVADNGARAVRRNRECSAIATITAAT